MFRIYDRAELPYWKCNRKGMKERRRTTVIDSARKGDS